MSSSTHRGLSEVYRSDGQNHKDFFLLPVQSTENRGISRSLTLLLFLIPCSPFAHHCVYTPTPYHPYHAAGAPPAQGKTKAQTTAAPLTALTAVIRKLAIVPPALFVATTLFFYTHESATIVTPASSSLNPHFLQPPSLILQDQHRKTSGGKNIPTPSQTQ